MSSDQRIPRRVKVSKVLTSRYQPGERPARWDERQEGEEEITTSSGERILLWSTGGQSSPAPGWELLLTEQVHGGTTEQSNLYGWTLYGISKEN